MQFGHESRAFGPHNSALKRRRTELTVGCQGVDGSERTATDWSARGWAAPHKSSQEHWPRKWSRRAWNRARECIRATRMSLELGQVGRLLLPPGEPQRGWSSGQQQDFTNTGHQPSQRLGCVSRVCPEALPSFTKTSKAIHKQHISAALSSPFLEICLTLAQRWG